MLYAVAATGFGVGLSGTALAQSVPGASPVQDDTPPIVDEALPSSPRNTAVVPLDEPIISDEEFEEAIPSLEDDLDAPLQSIEDFEDEQDAREAALDAQAERGTDEELADLPALQDGDTNEEIADAPVLDAELDEPLPPLEAFEVEPVEVAEDDADTGDVEIEYSVRIEGLEEIDRADDIMAQFDEFSALEEGDGDAANATMVAARATEDEALLLRLLEAEGYYDAAVSSRVVQREGGGPPLTALFTVAPGTRYTFGDIQFTSAATVPETLIDDAFPLEVGDPIVAGEVLGAEANIALRLPEIGYPFVEIGQRDILLDGETVTGDYTLPVETGPRSSFGGFTTSGDLAFGAEHVDTIARFERGELYDVRKVDDLRQALVATNLFSTVTVEPRRTGETAPDGTEYVTLEVVQDAGPPRSISGSTGYGTGEGFRIEAAWTHRNLFPPEGSLTVDGVAGTREQGLGVGFRRYNAGRRDRTVSLRASANRQDFDAFEAFTGTIAGRISYDSTPIWQKRFTYGYGFEITATNEQSFNLETFQRERETYFIGALPGQVGFDTSDSLLNPTEGYRAVLRVSPEASLSDGFSPYVRAFLDASTYYRVSDSIVVAGRVKLGTISGAAREDIAPSRRIYGGGGGSVRGFGFQELGPKVREPNPDFDPDDPDEEADPFLIRPIGGRSVNEAALELRYRFGNFGVVPFVDVGQVYRSSIPDFSDLRFGAGIGGRYYTNFGPLRFDVAMPLGRREGESPFSVYISIGQAF